MKKGFGSQGLWHKNRSLKIKQVSIQDASNSTLSLLRQLTPNAGKSFSGQHEVCISMFHVKYVLKSFKLSLPCFKNIHNSEETTNAVFILNSPLIDEQRRVICKSLHSVPHQRKHETFAQRLCAEYEYFQYARKSQPANDFVVYERVYSFFLVYLHHCLLRVFFFFQLI